MIRKLLLFIMILNLTGCDKVDISTQVANDFEQQYHMAKRNGAGAIDMCVQAGLAAAGFLQSKDELNYSKWKKIEKTDCSFAGIDKN